MRVSLIIQFEKGDCSRQTVQHQKRISYYQASACAHRGKTETGNIRNRQEFQLINARAAMNVRIINDDEVLLYVHRNRRLTREEPRTATSTFTQLLGSDLQLS